jgi:transposase InsO family protein
MRQNFHSISRLKSLSGDLVSHTISERSVLSMVTSMLDKAFARIPDGTNLILYSNQGWQYQHNQHQQTLQADSKAG